MQAEVSDPSEKRNQDLGGEGEALAADFLVRNGYQVREKNYRCRLGEVDLIVEKRFGPKKLRKISFVEVKTRRTVESVALHEVISSSKRRHISRVAQHYITAQGLQEIDADFAVILIDFSSGKPQIELLEDAFTLAWGY